MNSSKPRTWLYLMLIAIFVHGLLCAGGSAVAAPHDNAAESILPVSTPTTISTATTVKAFALEESGCSIDFEDDFHEDYFAEEPAFCYTLPPFLLSHLASVDLAASITYVHELLRPPSSFHAS